MRLPSGDRTGVLSVGHLKKALAGMSAGGGAPGALGARWAPPPPPGLLGWGARAPPPHAAADHLAAAQVLLLAARQDFLKVVGDVGIAVVDGVVGHGGFSS